MCKTERIVRTFVVRRSRGKMKEEEVVLEKKKEVNIHRKKRRREGKKRKRKRRKKKEDTQATTSSHIKISDAASDADSITTRMSKLSFDELCCMCEDIISEFYRIQKIGTEDVLDISVNLSEPCSSVQSLSISYVDTHSSTSNIISDFIEDLIGKVCDSDFRDFNHFNKTNYEMATNNMNNNEVVQKKVETPRRTRERIFCEVEGCPYDAAYPKVMKKHMEEIHGISGDSINNSSMFRNGLDEGKTSTQGNSSGAEGSTNKKKRDRNDGSDVEDEPAASKPKMTDSLTESELIEMSAQADSVELLHQIEQKALMEEKARKDLESAPMNRPHSYCVFTDTGDTETQDSQNTTQYNSVASELVPEDVYEDAEDGNGGVDKFINPNMDDSVSLLDAPPAIDDIAELEEEVEAKKVSLESTLSKLMESENHVRILEYKVESVRGDNTTKQKTIDDLNIVISNKDTVIVDQGKKIKDLEHEVKKMSGELAVWKEAGQKYLKDSSSKENTEKLINLTKKVSEMTKQMSDNNIVKERALVQAKENRELANNFRTQLLQEQGAHAKTKRSIPCSNRDCSGDKKQCPFGHHQGKRTSKINRPCRFFSAAGGCNEGNDCRFLHEKKKDETVDDIFENSSAAGPSGAKLEEKKDERGEKSKKSTSKKKKNQKKKEEVIVLESDEDKESKGKKKEVDLASQMNDMKVKSSSSSAEPPSSLSTPLSWTPASSPNLSASNGPEGSKGGTSSGIKEEDLTLQESASAPPMSNFNPEDWIACRNFQNQYQHQFVKRKEQEIKPKVEVVPSSSTQIAGNENMPSYEQVEAYFKKYGGSSSTIPVPNQQPPVFHMHNHPAAPTLPVNPTPNATNSFPNTTISNNPFSYTNSANPSPVTSSNTSSNPNPTPYNLPIPVITTSGPSTSRNHEPMEVSSGTVQNRGNNMIQPPINQFLTNVQRYEARGQTQTMGGQSPAYVPADMFAMNPVTRVSTPEAMAMMTSENQNLNRHGLSQLPSGGVLLGPWSNQTSTEARDKEIKQEMINITNAPNQTQEQIDMLMSQAQKMVLDNLQPPTVLANQLANLSRIIENLQRKKEAELRAQNQTKNIYQ